MDLLDKSNHCLVAPGVKGLVGASLDHAESFNTIFDWVLADVRVNVVPKVCDESHSVLELHPHSLIINGGPRS